MRIRLPSKILRTQKLYSAMPLINHEGYALGTLGVWDH